MSHRILGALAQLREVLPSQQKLTGGGLELYAAVLSDLPEQAVLDAIAKAAGRCRFFPVPAELRELAGEHRGGDSAIFAWEIAREAISSFGTYRSVAFDDPVINAAIRALGGWDVLCRMTSDDAPFRRKDFLAAYETCTRVGITKEQAAPLPGLHEMSGTKVEPVRIGSGGPRLAPKEAARLAEESRQRALPASPGPSEEPAVPMPPEAAEALGRLASGKGY